MQQSEGLGTVGWVALALVALAVVVALAFGFTALIYLALPMTIVVFGAIIALCTGSSQKAEQQEH
ncbi:MAG: hypothetical protein RMK81_12065 [Geminicoccaceae bacterium]|nr:hypothetical protein [Geminicoccaceae bacterium]